jgi:hypothetical protein
MPVFWAGKALSPDEELSLRRTVALLRRLEDEGSGTENEAGRNSRAHLELFLPENVHKWTPDELELAAHNGPWFQIGELTLG